MEVRFSLKKIPRCSVCNKKLGVLALDPCYNCKYDNPLFWCYKHNHFSHDRKPCKKCLQEQKDEKQKGRLIGL